MPAYRRHRHDLAFIAYCEGSFLVTSLLIIREFNEPGPDTHWHYEGSTLLALFPQGNRDRTYGNLSTD